MFTTKDPFGREVTLLKSTWRKHIISGHKELWKQELTVQRIIENPKFILPDQYQASREHYLDLRYVPKDGSLSILKVVVEFSNNTGDIITAYTIKSTTKLASTKRGVIYERPE